MGRNFRDSTYYRRTWLSKRTVKDGEACVKWSLGGKAKEIVGPLRFRTFFSTIRFMDRAKAGPFEYLRVVHRSGQVEHLRGPRALWINPVLHEAVTVEKAVHLTSPSECIVVYRAACGEPATPVPSKGAELVPVAAPAEQLARVVVRGPTVYSPAFGERVHEFAWTQDGAFGASKTLQTAPSTMALAAPLATCDGGHAAVTLRVGYQVTDVEQLLDGCQDLPLELRGALQSDFISVGRGIKADDLRNLWALMDVLAPRAGEDKASAARRALPHVAGRAAELGVALRFAEAQAVAPDKDLEARYRAKHETERTVAAEAERAREAQTRRAEAEERAAAARKEAEAKHAADVEATKRASELRELTAAGEAAAGERAHAATLEKAERERELAAAAHQSRLEEARRQLELLDVSAAKTQREVDAAKVRAAAAAVKNDETCRFLGKLKEAGVDTSQLLCETSKKPEAAPLEALLSAKLKPALALAQALSA